MTRTINHTERKANAVKAYVSLLNARLVEAIDLSLMAKQATCHCHIAALRSPTIWRSPPWHAMALARELVSKGPQPAWEAPRMTVDRRLLLARLKKTAH
jgi:hypothetical protein